MKMELGLRPKFSLLFVRIIILWDFLADLNFFLSQSNADTTFTNKFS